MQAVYPGYVDGEMRTGLSLSVFEKPTVESEDIGELIPVKRPRMQSIESELDELPEVKVENIDDQWIV